MHCTVLNIEHTTILSGNYNVWLSVLGSSILIIQNDVAGSNSYFFNRSWVQYKNSFGNPASQYWIGLDRLHNMSQSNCYIIFYFQNLNGSSYVAQYSSFLVGGASTIYKLSIGGYSGNLYDDMDYHIALKFSTYDADHDNTVSVNCALSRDSGFWFDIQVITTLKIRAEYLDI